MKWSILSLIVIFITLNSCSSTKDYQKQDVSLEESLNERNRTNLSLRDQIRQKPGVVIRQGVPVLLRNHQDVNGAGSDDGRGDNFEPLYVLNDYIVGNSFQSITQLVTNYDVKSIEILNGAEASFYGARGSNGVIKITTY